MQKKNVYFVSSLIMAIWFALTSSFWVYYVNIMLSFPFGILSLILWSKGRKIDDRTDRYKAITIILIIGVAVSLVMLVSLWFTN